MRLIRKVLILIISLSVICSFSSPALAAKHKSHKPVASKNQKKRYASRRSRVKKVVVIPQSSAPIKGLATFVNEVTRILRTADPSAIVGVYIKSMQNGNTLYTHNDQRYFIPASILKILTAEAALLYLGPDFTFRTTLMTDATSINNGVLNGNLYLIHSGDPSFTYNDLMELFTDLKSYNIQTIAGNVFIDNTAYDQVNFGPGWLGKDEKYCWGAPINASIINQNCFSSATYRPANVAQYNKSLVQNLLARLHIHVQGHMSGTSAPTNLSKISIHQSEPLRRLIVGMLKMSNNVIAGSLFKKIGELYSKRPGSWENGSKAVKQILSQMAGVNTNGSSVLDGSGLSRYNFITPAQMIQVLNFAYHDKSNNDFIAALPIAGVDGTLKHRLYNVSRKVRAKTGTMSQAGVAALAGYTMTKDQEPVAFVIMVNGKNGMGWHYKELEDQIVTAITRFSR